MPELRRVAELSFVPVGPVFDARPWIRRVNLALRGGDDALVGAVRWRDGAVAVRLFATGECSSDDEAWAITTVRGMVGLMDDPTDFFAVSRQHPLVAELARRHDTRIRRTATFFEAFSNAVLQQLVTTYEAFASMRRLRAIAGARVPGTTLSAAPTAPAVAALPMWQFHEIGVGVKRARTLRGAARRWATIETLRALPPEALLEKLTTLPGVGPWTANHVAREAFGWADAVPVGDLHAPYVVTHALTGQRGGDEEMVAALEPFRPHRARVAHLLMLAHVRGMVPGLARSRKPKVDAHRREPWRY